MRSRQGRQTKPEPSRPRQAEPARVVLLFADGDTRSLPAPIQAQHRPKRSRRLWVGTLFTLASIGTGVAAGLFLVPGIPLPQIEFPQLSLPNLSALSDLLAWQPTEAEGPIATAPIPPLPVDTAPLIEEGDALVAEAKIVEARPLFEKAARAGDPEGALRLGATYDPTFLKQARFKDKIQGDPNEAQFWYELAHRQKAAMGDAR